jgi:threonine dehydratase
MIPKTWLDSAAARLKPHVSETPLQYDPELNIFLKWENHQITGSFKLRGALNKVMTLQPWERDRGLIAASAGNHGQGVAFAGSKLGVPVIVFASEHAASNKLVAMRRLGADVRLVPGGYGEAEQAGLNFAHEYQKTWVSPYNDGQVIAGQGSLGLETLQQLEQSSVIIGNTITWVVPVGGGGLCSGIACAIYESSQFLSRSHRLVGVQSEASPFFHSIYHQGSQAGQIELPSLADGLAGPVEEGSVTIPILRRHLDDLILVSEVEIANAIQFAWEHYGEIIEGAAAASLAAVLSDKVTGRPAIVIISGGNISSDLHQNLCGDTKQIRFKGI